MPEATKKRPKVFDFLDAPPAIAYLDPSFLLNVLVSGASYHAECVAYAHRLEAAKTTLVLSNLGEKPAVYTCNPALLQRRQV